jgi:pSer/pThr/pTyr-binding forkhead associated (FHA) protein
MENDSTHAEQMMKVTNVPSGAYLIYNQTIFPQKHLVTYLGRQSDNDLIIKETSVSRKHAEIHYENGNFMLISLDSVNGTIVNKVSISKIALTPGTLIYLGDVTLVFVDNNQNIMDSLENDMGNL